MIARSNAWIIAFSWLGSSLHAAVRYVLCVCSKRLTVSSGFPCLGGQAKWYPRGQTGTERHGTQRNKTRDRRNRRTARNEKERGTERGAECGAEFGTEHGTEFGTEHGTEHGMYSPCFRSSHLTLQPLNLSPILVRLQETGTHSTAESHGPLVPDDESRPPLTRDGAASGGTRHGPSTDCVWTSSSIVLHPAAVVGPSCPSLIR